MPKLYGLACSVHNLKFSAKKITIYFIYLLITIQLRITFELRNFIYVLGVVPKTRVSGWEWNPRSSC